VGELLSPEMVGRLGRLAIAARRAATARRNGRRRVCRIGNGIETIDLRPYEVGDDPRRIAWHAYARLERLLVRLVADEAPLRLVLAIDESASMAFGAPSKLRQATCIAAGFAAVALGGEDRVALAVGSAGRSRTHRYVSGRASLPRLLTMLEAVSASGATDMADTVRRAIEVSPGRGICLLFSDLFEPQGLLAGAREARRRGYEVAIVEVLAPEEIDPPDLAGYDLEDAETGEIVELYESGVRERFAEALASHRKRVEEEALTIDAPVLRATTAEPFERIVMRAIETGLLSGRAA
jgi:uncharacterized protein (DUF58 family)